VRGSRLLTTVALSIVALAAVAGTACGGSDDDPGGLSKSPFATKANELCSKARGDRDQSEQGQVDSVLEAWRKRSDLADQYADAVGAMQDPATLASFTAGQARIDVATDPVAVQLGLTQCTRGTP
jgi:hypothetical protein